MLYDGIKLAEGSDAKNLVVETGTSFPSGPNRTPDAGELFYRTDAGNVGLWAFDGSVWQRLGAGSTLPDITTAGTYRSVTIDTKGLVTAGTNPTTLAGFGITDAAPLGHVGAAGGAHSAATTTVAGFMSAADKTKLDGLVPSTPFNGGTISNALTITSVAPQLTLGNPSSTSVTGRINVAAGSTGAGGNLQIHAGSATITGNQPGGDLTLTSGSGAGAGVNGQIVIKPGNSAGSTSSRLHLIGAINTAAGPGGSIEIDTGSSASGVGGPLIIRIGAAGIFAVERFRILANGAWSVGTSGTATGTTGQVLTSAGSGAPPTWQTSLTGDVTLTGTQTLTNKTISGGNHAGIVDISGSVRSALNTVTTNIDCSLGNYFRATVNGNVAFTFANTPASRAYSFVLEVTHTTGIITWPASVRWPEQTPPSVSTGRTHIFTFTTSNGGAIWRGVADINYQTL